MKAMAQVHMPSWQGIKPRRSELQVVRKLLPEQKMTSQSNIKEYEVRVKAKRTAVEANILPLLSACSH